MPDPKNLSFVGPAGVGKTHSLVEAVGVFAKAREWAPHEAVLGLTFMHGSRRRLDAKLKHVERLGVAVQCSTVDSFSLSLVRRFRQYLGFSGAIVIEPAAESWCSLDGDHRASFSVIRQSAVRLLGIPPVRSVVAASYPLLVVDEFQDCRGDLLEIVSALAAVTTTFLAADDFQALEIDAAADAALGWLRENTSVTCLSQVRRTDSQTILNAAHALREGVARPGCLEVVPVSAGGLGAWEVASRCGWRGWSYSRTVLISPTSPQKSKFTADVLKSLQKPLGKQRKVGPYPFKWVATNEQQTSDLCSKLSPDENFVLESLRQPHADPLLHEACGQVARRLRLRGETSIGRLGLMEEVKQFVQLHLAHRDQANQRGRIAMTVHGAKNREFENVVVLWPFELADDQLYRRKLLYNAVTRAIRRAVVIVAGGERRVKKDPVLQLLKR